MVLVLVLITLLNHLRLLALELLNANHGTINLLFSPHLQNRLHSFWGSHLKEAQAAWAPPCVAVRAAVLAHGGVRHEDAHHGPVRRVVPLQSTRCLEAKLVDVANNEQAVRVLVRQQLQARGQSLRLPVRWLLRLLPQALGALPGLGASFGCPGRGRLRSHGGGRRGSRGCSCRCRGSRCRGNSCHRSRRRGHLQGLPVDGAQLVQLSQQLHLLGADLSPETSSRLQVRCRVPLRLVHTADELVQGLGVLGIPDGAIDDGNRMVKTFRAQVRRCCEHRVHPQARV
mmetsp:Transcript_116680/g.341549  ORF Transcript_116680/g.341549 Transcript_116680/m.341549 type:complete len:285 (-) Transcript_116680:311-1165(-)